MTSELASAARDATFWAAVADYAKTQAADAKARMERAFDEHDLQIEKVRVPDTDGNELALIYINNGRWSTAVTDYAALLDWVTRRHPEEIQTTPAIRGAYMEKLSGLAVAGQGVAADPLTGEVVPGIEAKQGRSYLTVRKTALAKERAHQALVEMASASGYRLTQGENHEPVPTDDADKEDH